MKTINLNHICKIEGHADLALKIQNNKVQQCQLKAAEGARFFEALVINKPVQDIQEIVSRICGICSSAHSVASIQALENALGIQPPNQQKTIRELLMIGERIRSHTTHLYFLSLPDYYNVESALQLKQEHQDKINNALSLITLGNNIVETFGGREIHPFLEINKQPPNLDLESIKQQLEKSKPIVIKTINLFKSLKYPRLERETDYLSLHSPDDYASISGAIKSKINFETRDYKKHLRENIKEYATSKFVLKNNQPFQTGAIARINNNHDQLDKETKSQLSALKLPLLNPFHNNIAQAIELLQAINKGIVLLTKLISNGSKNFKPNIKAGHGVSAVEAPRGTLFHEYKINQEGKITYCNIITPTTQNLNMIEKDITTLVNQALTQNKSQEQIISEIEKLIRAYDPCFSCSTHFLRVKWL